ncbi:MAG: S-layer homology domain-containing protein, partial [Clostridia bacterium]|nr:S-layer homology domain-containing protein [Clostridia bacterium]
MKRIRIITLIAFAVILICALAVTSSAKWWDDNPFTDVESGGWYYDNVRVCKELGMLNGVSDSEFGVNTGMTRAMFVTTLAAASHYDASEYTESVFSDVPDGIWYAAPAAWAADKGITGGTGDGVFS